MDTIGSDFDTLLAVYTGNSITSLSPVASNDDIDSQILTSRVTFVATNNTTYQIAVDGFDGAMNDIALNINLSVIPTLQSTLIGNQFVLSWSAPATGYVLETSGVLSPDANWVQVPNATLASNNVYVVPNVGAGTNAFYRLQKQ